MGEGQKQYRLTQIYATQETQSGHATKRLQVDKGVFMQVGGDPVALGDEQAEKVSRFGRLELVDEVDVPLNLIDQPGIEGQSTSTAVDTVTGSTPKLEGLSSTELKKLAKDEKIEGYTTMNDGELKKALADHYNRQGA